MNNDLISREALKEDLKQYFSDGTLDCVSAKLAFNMILSKIENAPTVDTTCPHCDSGYAQGVYDGYLRAKEEVIHSIAKQYSEHNELVPIWLSIGDIKGGAE